MTESWHCLRDGLREAAYNMAFDEALLLASGEVGVPVLRFYGWLQAAASFGYSQKHETIAGYTPLRPLVRRPTGGGLVPHDADWTYSLIFPPRHWWYALKARESYLSLHRWIQAAFRLLGHETELSEETAKLAPGQCFAGPEQHDLLWRGKKIAGAAQRRSKAGLLIQGSVQAAELPLNRDAWEECMIRAAQERWEITWLPLRREPVEEKAAQLMADKYGRTDYHRKR